MVPEVGFEPTAYWLRVSCSAYWSYSGSYGTDGRIRTSINGFGDHCSSFELRPHNIFKKQWWGEQDSDLRTKKELSYSQPRLTTSLPPQRICTNAIRNGVAGEIRTLAPVSRPAPLARESLQPYLGTATDMERMMGIEPTCSAWKADVLAIELHPQWLRGKELHLRPSAYETDELLLLPPRNI